MKSRHQSVPGGFPRFLLWVARENPTADVDVTVAVRRAATVEVGFGAVLEHVDSLALERAAFPHGAAEGHAAHGEESNGGGQEQHFGGRV